MLGILSINEMTNSEQQGRHQGGEAADEGDRHLRIDRCVK